MTNEQKVKKLADELLDWEFEDKYHWKYRSGEFAGQYSRDGSTFDPYNNVRCFLEVLGALSDEHVHKLEYLLYNVPVSEIKATIWLTSNKDKVIEAILEVIDD